MLTEITGGEVFVNVEPVDHAAVPFNEDVAEVGHICGTAGHGDHVEGIRKRRNRYGSLRIHFTRHVHRNGAWLPEGYGNIGGGRYISFEPAGEQRSYIFERKSLQVDLAQAGREDGAVAGHGIIECGFGAVP